MKRKFNALDLLIVIIVLAFVAGGIFAVRTFTTEKTGETKIITVEVVKQKEYFTKVIKEDDVVYDGVKNVKMGKIVGYEVNNSMIDGFSAIEGTVDRVDYPGRFDILISIEVPVSADVQVGKQMWFETSTYKFGGYILGVEEGEKQ